MKALLASLVAFSVAALASANQSTYFGIYIQSQKVGYSSYLDDSVIFNGQRATKSVSFTKIQGQLLQTPFAMTINAVTYEGPQGKPLKMEFDLTSGGRSQKVLAIYQPQSVAIKIISGGKTTHRTLRYPSGAQILDDPLEKFGSVPPDHIKKTDFFVLDPTTVSFVKNSVVPQGKASIKVSGVDTAASKFEVIDPRGDTTVYVGSAGSILRVDGPLQMTLLPEPKAVALSPVKMSEIDLATGSKLTPIGSLSDPANLKMLEVNVVSPTQQIEIPSDEYQLARKSEDGWTVTVNPTEPNAADAASIQVAGSKMPQWVKPGLDLPADELKFKELAKKIIGDETNSVKAANLIQAYVYNLMVPDASMAILRSADDVLANHRGVCRDYSILTATLLRAAGIPAQVVTGLVNWDGDFYYHAWNKYYNGHAWIPLDSTTPTPEFSACHIELGTGSVSTAFLGPNLGAARVTILKAEHLHD